LIKFGSGYREQLLGILLSYRQVIRHKKAVVASTLSLSVWLFPAQLGRLPQQQHSHFKLTVGAGSSSTKTAVQEISIKLNIFHT
jgi:hypothetical protein